MEFNFKGKVFDIRPAILRRLLLVLVFGWITFILFIVMWIFLSMVMAGYEGYRMFMWWAVDYVKNVWDGVERTEKYTPFEYGE